MWQHWIRLGAALLASVAVAQTNSRSADRTYIEKAESDWAESVANRDCSVLERILAEDFVGVDLDGSHYTKEDALKSCRTEPSKFKSNHLDRVQIRFYNNMAIAQGSEKWKLKTGKDGKFVWTDTWLKRSGIWQIVAAEDLIPVTNPFTENPDAK
jgi:ketosteroid isomerase-like protein